MVCGVRSRHDHGVPTWVKVVLLVGAVVLLGLVDWVINGRALFAIAGPWAWYSASWWRSC
jgi:hypothetical protein